MKKGNKYSFQTYNTCFLAELGGTHLPPLTDNHPAQKPLVEWGGTPPPP